MATLATMFLACATESYIPNSDLVETTAVESPVTTTTTPSAEPSALPAKPGDYVKFEQNNFKVEDGYYNNTKTTYEGILLDNFTIEGVPPRCAGDLVPFQKNIKDPSSRECVPLESLSVVTRREDYHYGGFTLISRDRNAVEVLTVEGNPTLGYTAVTYKAEIVAERAMKILSRDGTCDDCAEHKHEFDFDAQIQSASAYGMPHFDYGHSVGEVVAVKTQATHGRRCGGGPL